MVILEKQNYNQNLRAYNEIKNQLKKQINKVIEITHVGSTSIPTIKYGKNIIDILIVAKDKKEFAEIANYGYYIFYQLTSENKTQLQWIREQFIKNIDTRRALININGIQHKIKTKDFPCTVGILFRIENNILNCDVQSRSTDVITGLPYDMGFFSVITELLANLLTSDLNEKIIPGYVAMHSSFTQIYDKTAKIADKVEFANKKIELQRMPEITNGEELLEDIYNLGKRLPKTKFMEWSIVNAK